MVADLVPLAPLHAVRLAQGPLPKVRVRWATAGAQHVLMPGRAKSAHPVLEPVPVPLRESPVAEQTARAHVSRAVRSQ